VKTILLVDLIDVGRIVGFAPRYIIICLIAVLIRHLGPEPTLDSVADVKRAVQSAEMGS
jgi:hypothetical protein